MDKTLLKSWTVNAKLDPPVTLSEKQIAHIWSDMLEAEPSQIGRYSSFFELGGDSINVLQFVGILRKMYPSSSIGPKTVFSSPTLHSLARIIDGQDDSTKPDAKSGRLVIKNHFLNLTVSPLRIVCFHGQATNSRIFADQLAMIINGFKTPVEFIFIDAKLETDESCKL